MSIKVSFIALLLNIIGILQNTINAQNNTSFTLIAHIAFFKNNKGLVRILLEDFQQKKVKAFEVTIYENKQLTLEINDLPAGRYALSFFHDENENKLLDTGLFGIPREGWGCSNNARGFMSAPKFEDKLFMLDKNKEIHLKVVNY